MREPFTQTITLYNHRRENRVDTWKRTVIRGVQWTSSRVNAADSTGRNIHSNTTKITIPLDADTGGARYCAPVEYSSAKGRVWTLNPADGLDVIVYGECNVEIGNGVTVDDLAKAQTLVTIKAASDNTARRCGKCWKVDAE